MSATDLGQAIQDLLTPLRELQKTAHREEADARARFEEARERKREIDKMLRAIDPEAEPFHKKNGGKKSGKGTYKYSPERVQQATDWVQANAAQLNAMNEGTGFYGSEVVERFPDPPISTQSGMSAVLRQLHELGIVRLAKTGGLGGRKYYKVVV